MKKIFALLVVIGMLAVAGAAFAADSGVPGGHVTPEPVTPDVPEEVEVPTSGQQETVVVVKQEETKVQAVIPPAAVVTEVTTATVNEVLKAETVQAAATVALAAVSDDPDVSAADVAKYTEQLASLDEKINTATEDKSTTGTGLLAQVFNLVKDVLGEVAKALTEVPVVKAADIPMTVSTQTHAEQISAAAQKLAQVTAQAAADGKSTTNLAKQIPVAVMPTMAPTTTGVAILPMPKFDKATYGKKVKYNNFKTSNKAGNSVKISAADDDEGEAKFMNSLGTIVDVVPGGEGDTSGAMPGYLSVATFMEAGETYEPVISVTNEEGEGAIQTTTEEVTVVVETVEVTEFVTASWAAAGVTNAVDGSVITALANLDSGSFDAKILDAKYISADGWKVDDDEEDAWETSTYELQPVALIFPIKGASEDGTHVFGIASFDLGGLDYEKISKDLDKSFHFYTDGAEAGKEISADVWTSISGDLVDVFPKDLFDDTEAKGRAKTSAVKSDIKSGYVTFAITTNSKYTKPLLAIKVNKSGNEDGGTYYRSSGGGGGCSAGFSGLALVVLGGLALLRKKK